MYLFVYGTLKRGFPNHYFLDEASYEGKARLPGFQMYSCGGFPCIVKADDYVVEGEVYYIDPDRFQIWMRLDRLEGTPRMYKRESHEIWLSDETPWPAQVYIWNQSTDGLKLIEDGIWR
jgi:gamma-glutamylaminecyclotransferase